ncbi:MAG: NIL domain-containing protein [Egibacteraceae bacterium]
MATARWHLTFPEELVQQPIVYRLVSDHGLVVNVRRADVDVEVGWMLLECSGDEDALARGRAYLERRGVVVTDPTGDIVAG